jgi:uncharacterized protein with HEPN domain
MSSRSWQLRIQDILESAISIQAITQGLQYEEFCQNKTMIKAVLYDYLIIGEASRHIPSQIQLKYPQISWRLMADMRNVIAHEYFQVRTRLIWEGINQDIPLLTQQLQELLKQE